MPRRVARRLERDDAWRDLDVSPNLLERIRERDDAAPDVRDVPRQRERERVGVHDVAGAGNSGTPSRSVFQPT